MTTRFICPHCHHPVVAEAMDAATSAGAQYRICPECDEPIQLPAPDAGTPVPATEAAVAHV